MMPRSRQSIALPRPRSGGGSSSERVSGFVDGATGGGIGKDGIDGSTGLAIDENDAWTFRREVFVAPCHKREKHGPQITPARGQQVFVARRMFAVAVAFEQTRVDQRIQPPRQHVWRDAETLLELVETRHSLK